MAIQLTYTERVEMVLLLLTIAVAYVSRAVMSRTYCTTSAALVVGTSNYYESRRFRKLLRGKVAMWLNKIISQSQ